MSQYSVMNWRTW